jgi:serine phosphatase RsbU (regulator of sigma subunit)
MKRIEDIIKQNREAFNTEEPGTGHFDKFQKKLQESQEGWSESWFERYNIVLKIAAAVLIFAAITTIIYTDSFTYLKRTFTNEIVAAELPAEVVEVMQYYNVIADKKINQIDDLAVSEAEANRVKEMALKELQMLEDDRNELKAEYTLNPNNERIVNALLLNQQKRAEILDKIINTLNQIN